VTKAASSIGREVSVPSAEIRYECDGCGSEWTAAFQGVRCPDCGHPLKDLESGQLLPDTSADTSVVDLDSDDTDDDVVVSAFETSNPWLRKLFALPEFGKAPGMAIGLLRSASPDPEERLLGAIKCGHGLTNRGYLIATTHFLRWIQTLPFREDDFWPYNTVLQVSGNVITTSDGMNFQVGFGHLGLASNARKFAALYRAIPQAKAWEDDHAQALAPPSEEPSTSRPLDLAEQLEKIARLHSGGLLTDDEFAQAKKRLLS
jgi:hypothetical protein